MVGRASSGDVSQRPRFYSGYAPERTIFYTLQNPPDQKYTKFSIPKKSGGTREITAPTERLKALQRKLANLLANCRDEIEQRSPRKIVSHGFRSGGSISTNAVQYRKRRYVLNLDLANLFPTLNFGRVRGYFIKNQDFSLHPSVATVIAQIACDGTALPQGSPCSPIISDLLAHLLDVRLVQLARKHKCTYSRYADDLTLSTNQKDFPPSIAYKLDQGPAWVLGDELLEQINSAGFGVNHQKTRMQYRTSRQVVTGLSVNQKVNIRADYYRSARLACAGVFATGGFHLQGNSPNEKGSLDQLQGILSHIYYIKRMECRRTDSQLDLPPKKERSGIVRLYDRFLFFRKFVVLEKPLVICEGSTDSIYLDAAVRHLPNYAGVLFNIVNGKKESAIKYFKYTTISREVMGLGGGTGNFPKLMARYDKMISTFKYAPLTHPVILLCDNDDGAKKVFAAAKHISASFTTTAPFYEIKRNLYLIKTPEMEADGQSKIEDLFDAATLGTKVDGKKFNPGKNIDAGSEYGKTVFAEKVIAPNAGTVNFSGFKPLLDRIVATIKHHEERVAAGAV